MDDKKNPPVTLSLSVFPDVQIEVAPTSELELEVATPEEITRKGERVMKAVGDLSADEPLRKSVRVYVAPVVGMGVAAAVRALKKSTKKPKKPKKGTAEAVYAGMVKALSTYRKKRKKQLEKQGYNEETGLIHPKPCEKLPKLAKAPKLTKLQRLPKAQKLPSAAKAVKATKLKRLKNN